MEGFTDIEGPVPVLVLWLIGLACLLSAAAVVIVSWLILRQRRERAGQADSVAVRSPLEIALSRLERLKETGESMDADPYTVEVSEIVREYLESSLQVPAREQTTEEFLFSLQSTDKVPDALKEHMPHFLNQCDWVKFARQSLELEERHHLLKTAETVVDVTDTHLRKQQADSPSAPVAS